MMFPMQGNGVDTGMTRHHGFTRTWLLVLTTLVTTSAAHAQPGAALFSSNDVIELTLTAPIRTLVNKRTRRPEVDGTLSYTDANGEMTLLDLEVRTRGKNRLSLCRFPPLSLNFKRRQVAGTLFSGQNRLKLATRCQAGERYEQYLYLEYLIYRIYQQVTDNGFRVRPVNMRYVDSERDRVDVAPGFLIEHIDGVAARTMMSPVEQPSLLIAELNPLQTSLYMIFQYLVGNTDFSALMPADDDDCCHNTDLLGPRSGDTGLIPVPYDFD